MNKKESSYDGNFLFLLKAIVFYEFKKNHTYFSFNNESESSV
jgi:hypothetical protein